MENYLKEFWKDRNLSDSSIKLYTSNIKRLNDNIIPKNLNFLKNTDTILEKIDKYKPTTKRSYLISIVSLLKEQPKFIQRFIHNGKEYGFIPNLDEITAGEYIDLDSFLKDESTYNKAISVLYRPILNKRKDLYNIEEYNGSHEDFNTLSLEIALGSMLFFWNLSNELLKTMKEYLLQPKNQMTLEAVLAQSGVGINQFIQSLEDVSLILKEQLNLDCTSF